jgi:spore germination protein
MKIYTVKSGDSIYSIARENGTTPGRIIADNQIENPGRLSVGEALVLLYPTQIYTVKQGDTLQGIADMFGVSRIKLMQNNPSSAVSEAIYPGQTLNIKYDDAPLGNIYTNGYAYPYIDEAVLRRTLPYLTYLSVFSYGFRPDGTLIPPRGGDEALISIAKEYDTVPLLTLTSVTEAGTFSNELVNSLLSNTAVGDSIIAEVIKVMEEKGYGGVDIDFEYVSPQYAGDYADFIRRMRDAASPLGYVVFASLAPKTSSAQSGLLYEGHDYGGVGSAADYVLLMTYEWGYTYSAPMAVSPINQVRRVLDYAVTEIPAEKIFMGVPNYGYNWSLPYVKGTTKAQSLSNLAAVELARDRNAEIQYDEASQSPYFKYYERPYGNDVSVEHEVWFENARSMEAMLSLAAEYGFAGIGVWNIMRYFPQMWLVMNSLYNIVKITAK